MSISVKIDAEQVLPLLQAQIAARQSGLETIREDVLNRLQTVANGGAPERIISHFRGLLQNEKMHDVFAEAVCTLFQDPGVRHI